MNAPLKVLHINSETGFRGGENQLFFLLTHSQSNIKHLVACRANSALEHFCRDNCIPYITLPLLGELDAYSAYKISRYCKGQDIALMHAHTAHAHSIALLSQLMGNPAKLIVSRRVNVPIKKHILSRLKYNHPKVSRIVCVSNAVAQGLQRQLTQPQRCVVVHSGVDDSRFTSSDRFYLHRELNIDPTVPLIGNIAALTHEKDHDTFLAVAKRLCSSITAKYLIIGSGDREPHIRKEIMRLGLESKVVLTGARNDIEKVLPSLSILLLTSKTEGFPNIVLEAFACGTPTVATAVGGVSELIVERETGLLAPAGDINGLSTAVLNLINDQALCGLIRERAKKFVKQFSMQRMADDMCRVYLELA